MADLPRGWRAGGKTDRWWDWKPMVDKVNDSAIFWLPRRAPVIVTAYFDGLTISNGIRPGEEAVLTNVGRLAAGGLTG